MISSKAVMYIRPMLEDKKDDNIPLKSTHATLILQVLHPALQFPSFQQHSPGTLAWRNDEVSLIYDR